MKLIFVAENLTSTIYLTKVFLTVLPLDFFAHIYIYIYKLKKKEDQNTKIKGWKSNDFDYYLPESNITSKTINSIIVTIF